MKRTLWMTTVVFMLGIIWLLTGVAWADPSGAANVPQILNVTMFRTPAAVVTAQRTFLTTDGIQVVATYYDPNPACAGVDPMVSQLLFFNQEGQLILTHVNVSSTPQGGNPKYPSLAEILAPGALAPGAYNLIFLVRDCTNVNIFVSGFYAFRVLTP